MDSPQKRGDVVGMQDVKPLGSLYIKGISKVVLATPLNK